MSWIQELNQSVTSIEQLQQYIHLSEAEQRQMAAVIHRYPMSIPKYYLSLIDPADPHDPIGKMAMPSLDEMSLEGDFDTSGEADNTVSVGVQHKYAQTALVLSTNLCAMYCRHCFRKRLVGLSDEETVTLFDEAARYIGEHKEISNVLISGGDAFLNSNAILEHYLAVLSQMEHLNLIRFGTRTPVVLPMRIYDDVALLAILKHYNSLKQIYVVTQFNHPKEITTESKKAIKALMDQGIVVSNQSVLLKGVNDQPETLAQLMNELSKIGVVPYYVFQCRPVTSVKNQFQVPLNNSYQIVEQAKAMLNGHTKRFRWIMSHETGKIEILGNLPDGQMLFKYHQAKNPQDHGRIFAKMLQADQCWLDEI